ncbi:MAG: thioredoxin family protein [Lachnospiraceae bacterium]|nr:thioredoxin family protein [Lachnospiraceae bacterium]
MKNLEIDEKIDELIAEKEIVIFQFGTETCAPCSAIKQKIDHWIENHKEIKSRYVSIEKFPEIAAEYGIFSAPTIVVFISGKLSIRESGYFSLDDIFKRIERYVEMI